MFPFLDLVIPLTVTSHQWLSLCRYGRKALQEMYQVFLRRRTPNTTATPAWMEELLKDVLLEDQTQRRTELFDVSLT